MSRRARLEEEKLKHLNDDLKDEEDKLKLQKERVYAPILWKRLNSGIRIQDLKPKYYDEVQKLVEEYYLPEDVLTRNTRLKEDQKSLESFMHKVLFNLQDRTSIIALDEANGDEVAGFLVLKVVHKVDFGRVFSRVQLVDGEAHKTCVTFTSLLSRKAEIFQDFNCDVFLRYYLLCIKPQYRKKGLGYHLMLAAVDVARSLDIPVIMGLFSCFSLQKLAKRIGMRVVHEMNYVDWKNRMNELIFEEPGIGNYTCAVMAGEVPPPPEPEPPPPKQEDEEENMKLTREEKRKLKAKAKAKAKK